MFVLVLVVANFWGNASKKRGHGSGGGGTIYSEELQ